LRHGVGVGTIAEVTVPSRVLIVGAGTPAGRAGSSRAGELAAAPPPPWPPEPDPSARGEQPGRQGRTVLDTPRQVPGQGIGADETAELPIFREVSNRWFAGSDEPQQWHSAADDGWRAAAAAAAPRSAGSTRSGMPRRIP